MLNFQIWIPISIKPGSWDDWNHRLNIIIHLYKHPIIWRNCEKEWWNLCPFRSTLHPSQPSYLHLEADLYRLHHWAPLSSGFQLGLKNGEHQQEVRGQEEQEVGSIDSLSSVSTESLQVGCLPLLKATATFRQPRTYNWVPIATPSPCSSRPRSGNNFSIILLPG